MKSQRNSILIVILAGLLAFAPVAQAKKDKGGYLASPAASVQGTVVRYLVNPFGEVDGLILDNGTLAKTPPHLSGDLVGVAKPGDRVTLQGTPEAGTSFKVYSVTNTASNKTLLRRDRAWHERSMPKHLRAAGLKEMSASGTIEHVLTGKRGEPNGVILSNGAIVRVGPKEAYPYFALFRVGAPFAARGFGTENGYGRALEATAIGAGSGSLQPLFGPAIPGQPGTR